MTYKFEIGDVVHLKGHSETAKFLIKHRKVETQTYQGEVEDFTIQSKLYSNEGVGWFNETGLEKVTYESE